MLEKLPAEYDSRVKAMEIDERPTEQVCLDGLLILSDEDISFPFPQYSDIGGLDKQIQEIIEACVLPMIHKDRFINLGIQPPKVLEDFLVSHSASLDPQMY